ncbi:hypothetical protein O6H91_11G056200 [Diphasiastrum complanatum]|uniref:Uncharacterized protein n=1 Tax=Diphasiastrum complanatum TaxID=34168 RepID=A0ACC2C9G5_DIPCM|nr:hypothetical protein O6H91_Y523300 [Diphasiastrum complanatum]KAJ7538611.1 hypothetical protein O6H91_11G056200 [Diphasiastrum complanatum]
MPQSYENDIEDTSISTRDSVARSFPLSSLRLDFSTLHPSHPEELSPFTNYILAVQKELLSTPTPTLSIPPDFASRSHSDQIGTLASPYSAPEHLSYNDSGSSNLAVHVNLLHPLPTSISTETTSGNICASIEDWKLRITESNEMREACQEEAQDFEDHKTSPSRESSLPSSPLLAGENCCQSLKAKNSANSRLKRTTPEVPLDDLGNRHVEEPDQKCKSRSRETFRHENRQPRFAIETVSEREMIDDGYRWRKYGRKTVKQSPHHRNYYKCSNPTCMVKKRVERSSEDSSIIITTYEGNHTHPSPSIVYGDIVQPNESLGLRYMAPNAKKRQPRNSYDLFVQMGEF